MTVDDVTHVIDCGYLKEVQAACMTGSGRVSTESLSESLAKSLTDCLNENSKSATIFESVSRRSFHDRPSVLNPFPSPPPLQFLFFVCRFAVQMRYDPVGNISCLQEVFVSRASARQRSGRAGTG